MTTNTNVIEKNWVELKGKILSKWTKFSDVEVEGVKADLNLLAVKIEKAYGIAKDQAQHQFEDFKKSVGTLIGIEAASSAAAAEAAPTPKVVAALNPATAVFTPLAKPEPAKIVKDN